MEIFWNSFRIFVLWSRFLKNMFFKSAITKETVTKKNAKLQIWKICNSQNSHLVLVNFAKLVFWTILSINNWNFTKFLKFSCSFCWVSLARGKLRERKSWQQNLDNKYSFTSGVIKIIYSFSRTNPGNFDKSPFDIMIFYNNHIFPLLVIAVISGRIAIKFKTDIKDAFKSMWWI